MKKFLSACFLTFTAICSLKAQTLIWSENFTNNGAGWNLNVVNGAEGAQPNFFVVNDNEGGGLNPGSCGVSGNGNNTLHVTSFTFPNNGASYDAGGLCGILTCPQTNRSAISPSFNAFGYSTLTIKFNYIENGQGSIDNASMTISNGTTSMSVDMPKSPVCSNGQGEWTAFTVNLPNTFLLTSNMTISFKWVNNDDGNGIDPSFAVDDIQVLGTPLSNNSITTLPLTTTLPNNQYCPCHQDTVSFVSTGTFNIGNVYTAQLSDANGSFASPTVIGTLSGTANSGNIPITIPCNALYGTSYRIRVVSSNPNVIGSDNGTNLTINAFPPFTLTTTPSNPVCPNNPVTLAISPSLPTGYTLQWYRATNPFGIWMPLSTTTNPFTFIPPPGSSFYYMCIVTNVLCGTQDTVGPVQIIVNPIINITVNTIPANMSNVCPGNSIALCASSSSTATFSWTGGISNCVAFTPTATNTYTVTASDANGCTNTSSTTITVGPVPLVISSNPSPANVCIGSPLTLCASGASTYSWSGGVTNCIPFTNYTNGTYTVTGTDANGCTANATITVNVLSLPTITTTAIPSNATVCQGSPLTLCASGASTYSWTGGITNCIPFNAQSAQIYYVIGTDANGCTNTSSINVSLLPLPNIGINTTPSSGTICNGSPATLCATGASTYSWTGGITNCVPFTPSASATYTVTATGTNGCTTTSSATITVFNHPSINITLTPNTNTICQGDPLTLCATGSGTTYTWSGGVVNCTANTNLSTGVYTVTASNAACSSTSTVAITVTPNQTPTISISSSPSPVIVGQNATFTANVGAATTYQIRWYKGGSFLLFTNSPVNTMNTICTSPNDSIYAVLIPSGCYSPDSAKSNILKPSYPESVSELSVLGIRIYPNPVKSELHISHAHLIEFAELYAVNGDLIQSMDNKPKQQEINFDLSRLAKGLYILKLNSQGTNYYQKVLKE